MGGSQGSETQILYFRNNYSKRALKKFAKDLQRGFLHSVRTSCQNFKKNHKDKANRPLLMFVLMPYICPVSNGIFPSHSTPKVLLDPIKNIIFIMELYKLHKVGRKSTRSSLGSKTQTLHVWNNYFKLARDFATWFAIFCANKNSKNSLK